MDLYPVSISCIASLRVFALKFRDLFALVQNLWSLTELLTEAFQFEDIQLQIHDMKNETADVARVKHEALRRKDERKNDVRGQKT